MKTRPPRGLYAPELLEPRIAPATFIVTSLLDPTEAGKMTLRDAILAANGSAGADTVKFDKTLAGKIDLTGGEIAITESVKIVGPGPGLIQVSGGDASRIFMIDDTVAGVSTVSISGLALIDGKAAGGGGAVISKESLFLKDVVISSSFASGRGGGLDVETDGKLLITASKILDNRADTERGGGLYAMAKGGIVISKSLVSGNSASSRAGGLYLHTPADSTAGIVVDATSILRNTAGNDGGGVNVQVDNMKYKAVIKNSLISGNTSTDTGGGLFLGGGLLSVEKTTFSSNAANSGGAFAMDETDGIVIKGSSFFGNRATDPGGVGGGALFLDDTAKVSVQATTFSGNFSENNGGAITANNGTTLDLKKATFTGNVAMINGGGVYGGGFGGGGATINVTGSTFTGNRAANAGGGVATLGDGVDATPLNVVGSLFQGNIANLGGGITAMGSGAILIKGAKVLGNIADAGSGGGLYLSNTSTTMIIGSLISRNFSVTNGGGLFMDKGIVSITSTLIADNHAVAQGAGLFVNDGDVTVAKSKILANVAGATGGGLFNLSATAVKLMATKLSGNVAPVDPATSGLVTYL